MQWNIAPGIQAEGYYHSSTQLPNDHLSIMVDIGAWTSLGGSKLVKKAAAVAMEAGHKPNQRKLKEL